MFILIYNSLKSLLTIVFFIAIYNQCISQNHCYYTVEYLQLIETLSELDEDNWRFCNDVDERFDCYQNLIVSFNEKYKIRYKIDSLRQRGDWNKYIWIDILESATSILLDEDNNGKTLLRYHLLKLTGIDVILLEENNFFLLGIYSQHQLNKKYLSFNNKKYYSDKLDLSKKYKVLDLVSLLKNNETSFEDIPYAKNSENCSVSINYKNGLSVNVDSFWLYYYSILPKFKLGINYLLPNKNLDSLCSNFKKSIKPLLKSKRQSLLKFLNFIRTEIEYENDTNNIFKFPLQTINDKRGDCEDISLLFAYMQNKIFGHISILILTDSHVQVGIEVDMNAFPNDTFFSFEGKSYLVIEPGGNKKSDLFVPSGLFDRNNVSSVIFL